MSQTKEYKREWYKNNIERQRAKGRKYAETRRKSNSYIAYQSKYKERALELQRERTYKKKQLAVDLLGGKCQDCTKSFPLCVYDFHHLDRSKKLTTISKLISKGTLEALLNEIKKCVLLCANCHRLRHNNDT